MTNVQAVRPGHDAAVHAALHVAKRHAVVYCES